MSYTNQNHLFSFFFQIVPDFLKPRDQLMSLHGFFRRYGREQQFPPLFTLMSSRKDYVQVSDQSYYWELNEVQSPYVVGLNKRNDFCEN